MTSVLRLTPKASWIGPYLREFWGAYLGHDISLILRLLIFR
jgi:hypothetical protein